MKLEFLSEVFSICKLSPDEAIPSWALRSTFFSITRTLDELSIVCLQAEIPADVREDGHPGTVFSGKIEKDWLCFKVQGPLDFGLTGILVSLANPLAEAQVSIFAISTFDTDYILVRAKDFNRASSVLAQAGHEISHAC